MAGVEKLRTRYIVAPLSNGHVAMLVHLARATGITWDAGLGADIFRHYKPDPETYLVAGQLADFAPVGQLVFCQGWQLWVKNAASLGWIVTT